MDYSYTEDVQFPGYTYLHWTAVPRAGFEQLPIGRSLVYGDCVWKPRRADGLWDRGQVVGARSWNAREFAKWGGLTNQWRPIPTRTQECAFEENVGTLRLDAIDRVCGPATEYPEGEIRALSNSLLATRLPGVDAGPYVDESYTGMTVRLPTHRFYIAEWVAEKWPSHFRSYVDAFGFWESDIRMLWLWGRLRAGDTASINPREYRFVSWWALKQQGIHAPSAEPFLNAQIEIQMKKS